MPSLPKLSSLRSVLWPQPGRDPARLELKPWHAWAALAGILVLVLWVNGWHLSQHPFPAPSSHRTWRLVPQLLHHFQGYAHHSPAGPDSIFLGGMGCFYSLPAHDPIPWTSPAGLWQELSPGGRLYQLWGACPDDFFSCMPHAFAVPAAVGALFPGHFLLVALVPTFYFLALILGMYGIGVEVADRPTGLAAAAIAAGYPALFGFARWPEGYIVAASLSTVMVWCLLRSKGLTRLLPLLGFTLLAWTAIRTGEGMAEAAGAGLAVSGVFLVELGRGLVDAVKARRVPWRWALGLTLVLGLLCLSMDWRWVQGSFDQTFTGFTEVAMDATPGAHVSSPLQGWLYSRGVYLLFIYKDYLLPLMVGLLLLALPLLALGRARHKLSLLLWFLIPLLGVSSMARKAIWYAVPMIPPLAALTAAGLSILGRKRVKIAALTLAAGCGLFQLVVFSNPVIEVGLRVHPFLRRPLPPQVVNVRWHDLLGNGTDATRHLKADADAFLAWLDGAVPPSDTLKQVAVITPWGEDLQQAYSLRWYLSLHRPDLSVVELSNRLYLEAGYPKLSTRNFAFLIRTDSQGRFLPCCDEAGAPVVASSARPDRPPPALGRKASNLVARGRGTVPGIPPVLVLEHPELDAVPLD